MFGKVSKQDDCVHEPPGGKPPGKPPTNGVPKMGQKFTVECKSTLPPATAEWTVDLGDDPKGAMIYTNLAYDLIAAAMAKLGVEMSKYVLGESSETQLNAEMTKVQDALRAGSVAG